jgi:predicted transcriptional regulator
MSILSDVLQEEYARVLLTISAYEREALELPKGHIAVKRIKNHDYFYLQWREGEKTRSQYIKKEDVEELRKQIERRNHLVSSIRDMRKAEKEFQKVLGREL